MHDDLLEPSNLVPLPRDFFDGEDVDHIAQELLGTIIVLNVDEVGPVGGAIVETEAYDQSDPTAHCFESDEYARRPRSEPMLLAGGHVYIFPASYGYCLNLVTGKSGIGSAVLIRSLRPLIGKKIMRIRRGPYCPKALLDETLLCHTPVTLCESLGIAEHLNCRSLFQLPFQLFNRREEPRIVAASRVRVAQTIKRLRPALINTPFGESAIKKKRRWIDVRSVQYVHARNRTVTPID